MNGRKIRLIAGGIILAICILGGVWFALSRPRPMKVMLTTVLTHTLQSTLFESGTVKPADKQMIYSSQLAGNVQDMKVQVGDKVKKDQVLFTVVNLNGFTYAVHSKMSGEVLLENESGIASDGTPAPIIEIVSPDKQITANVSEIDGVQIRKSMRATISSDAYPGQTFSARVFQVADYATQSPSGSGQVEVDLVPEKPLPIPLGYQVDIHILSTPHQAVLAIPYNALVQNGDNYVVFRYSNGFVQSVPVTLGMTTDDYVEVIKGLHLGDRIVMNPSTDLTSGTGVVT